MRKRTSHRKIATDVNLSAHTIQSSLALTVTEKQKTTMQLTNMHAVVDRLVNEKYTKAEVIKMLRDAVYW